MKEKLSRLEILIIIVIIIIPFAVALIPRFVHARRETTFPKIITLYSQEEYEEVMSAFTYYNKYRESMMMERIIWRIK